MKKWASFIAGIILQVILGSVYSWSVFTIPLRLCCGLGAGQSGLIFGVMIAVFASATIPAGRLLQARGPKLTAGLGAVFFAGGYLIASFSGGNYLILLLGIGVASGIGIGFGYVCPLTVGMKWFPDKKGFITGVSVAGFGGGAIIMSALAEHLLLNVQMSVLDVFGFIGVVYGGIAFLSAMLMSEPSSAGRVRPEASEHGVRQHIFSAQFMVVCLGMFSGTFAGLLVIGNLMPMMLSAGLEEVLAVLSISLFAAGNVGGRILWGAVHDRLGSRKTILFSLLLLCFSLVLLLMNLPAPLLLLTVIAVGVGFGGCFVIYASSIAELYGMRLFPRLYPACFLFYGLAALTGPPLGGLISDLTGSYSRAIISAAAAVILSVAVIEVLTFKKCVRRGDEFSPGAG